MSNTHNDDDAQRLFAGAGDLRALCRSANWGATALGPTLAWPASLRTAVRLCLDSRTTMGVWAGREGRVIYNEGYIKVLGNKHPWALGRPAREVWPEMWHLLGPEFEQVMNCGMALRRENQRVRLRRYGQWEDAYFTYSLTPISEEDGSVVGLMGILEETTGSVRAQARQEEFLAFAMESAQMGAWELDEQSNSTHRNVQHDRIFGYTEPLQHWNFDRFIEHVVPEHQEKVAQTYQHVLETHASWNLDFQIIRADGERRWVTTRGGYFEQGGDGQGGMTGVVQDITERKAAEDLLRRSEARQAYLLRLGDALRPQVDPQQMQATAARLLGQHLAASRVQFVEIEPDAEYSLVTCDDPAGLDMVAVRHLLRQYPGFIGEARAGRAFVANDLEHDPRLSAEEKRLCRESEVNASVFVPLFREGRLTAALAVHLANSHAWRLDEVGLIEQTAERAWDAVWRTLDERAVRDSRAQLQEADRSKDKFLAVLSHELRNPLAPIKNGLYILARAPAGGDKARRAREVIERQVDQLSHLVDDLLDVTRINRGKVQLHRSRLELNQLIERCIEDHRSHFERGQLRVELQPAPERLYVSADWNRLAQVISNLLQNAAKFTGPHGIVRVSVQGDMAQNQAVICVADTGAGIAADVLPQLFEPFMQVDTTLDRSSGGLGLGLALVRGLVMQHGGSVEAHSEGIGCGAEFVVRLPLDTSEPDQPQDLGQDSPALRRRVLVIEDNLDAAQTLTEVLQLLGHEVELAHSGPDGIDKARAFFPNLVLCDLGLPGMDGFALAQYFRSDANLANIPLVAVSGYAQPEDLERAANAGFATHMAKPPTVEKLKHVLQNIWAGS